MDNSNRPPPQDDAAEISLIGSMCLDGKKIPEVTAIIKSADLFQPDHQLIFTALADMNAKSQPIDFVTLRDYMELQGTLKKAGGIQHIVDLAENVPSSANAVYYAQIVRDKAIRRKLIQTHSQAVADAYDPTKTLIKLVDGLDYQLGQVKSSMNGTGRPDLDLLNAENIMEKEITWFWWKRIAKGTVNFLVGDMDRGKSYLSLDLAARFSNGDNMPDGTEGPPAGNVLIIAQEDSYQKTGIKRLKNQNANLKRIFVSRGVPTNEPDIFRMWRAKEDRKLLEHEIIKHDIKLVIIDPLKAYLGGINTNDETEVRDALEPYVVLADRTDAVFLFIAHNNKGGSTNATHRQGGSVAFGAIARSVWTVEPNKESNSDKEESMFMRTKNNWAAKADNPALFYYIDDDGLHWTGEQRQDYTAQDHIDQEYQEKRERNKSSPKAEECKKWILATLMGGDMSGIVLEAEAIEAGHSRATFKRARSELQNKSEIVRIQGFSRKELTWSLPIIDRPPS